jgi:hypothetical protein
MHTRRAVADVRGRRAHARCAISTRSARAHVNLILAKCVRVAGGTRAAVGARARVLTRAAVGAHRRRLAHVNGRGAVDARVLLRANTVVRAVGGYACGAVLTRLSVAESYLDLASKARVACTTNAF